MSSGGIGCCRPTFRRTRTSAKIQTRGVVNKRPRPAGWGQMDNIFVGYDSREDEAFRVCEASLYGHAARDIGVMALKHRELRLAGLFTRPWRVDGPTGQYIDERDGRPFSTEFSHTRFLTPAIARATGVKSKWVLFCDCDFLFMRPVKELFDLADDKYAVMVCKHEHVPSELTKMDGVAQTTYKRKNWSSLALWNIEHPANEGLHRAANERSGSYLHGFEWLPDELIGALPPEWNWIENVVPKTLIPKAVHYSVGGPWFDKYKDVAYAADWIIARDAMRRSMCKIR